MLHLYTDVYTSSRFHLIQRHNREYLLPTIAIMLSTEWCCMWKATTGKRLHLPQAAASAKSMHVDTIHIHICL